MNALSMLLIAAWIWFCLVMCQNNHMRIAVFGPILIPLGVLAVFVKWLADQVLRFNRWIGRIGYTSK